MSDNIEENINTTENNEGSSENMETKKILHAPRPLTEEEFSNIITLSYMECLPDKKFMKVFECEKSSENIAQFINGDKEFTDKQIKAINKNLSLTIKEIQNHALDGNHEVAIGILEHLANFSTDDLSYINYKEGNQPNITPYLYTRFSQVPGLFYTLQFVDYVNAANQIGSTVDSAINMKNAEKIYSNLRGYESNLDNQQKSTMYFLASEVFRKAQIVPGLSSEPKPSSKEVYCLKMVLSNTNSLTLTDCCLDRLSDYTKLLQDNIPLLISAYKRVLADKKTIFPEDAHRINSQIASLYQQKAQSSHISGFQGLQPDTITNLKWAEMFYRRAFAMAPDKRHEVSSLHSIAKVQSLLGLKQEAINTYLEAAYLIPEPERYENILDIAQQLENTEMQKLILNTVKKIKRAKIDNDIKQVLYTKSLEIIKRKSHDDKVISSVERLVTNTKLTPNKKIVRKASTRE